MMNNLFVKEVSMLDEIPSDNYLSNLPVIKFLENNNISFTQPVTFIVGENGTGKSTLIEAVAISLGFNPEGGTKNFNFSTENTHSDLHKYIRIAKGTRRAKDGFFLRAESFYNVASNIDDMDEDLPPPFLKSPYVIESYGGVSLHHQSHGESFMALAENRFAGEGIYILDEPEAALSPMRLMKLMCIINKLIENESQFIISTHSPILMTFPGADIIEITETGVAHVSYEETQHYSLTKRFLNNPEKMLSYLLEETDL